MPSSENEISSRLKNLMNICEIAANNSNLNEFDCAGWQIGKAYGDRVFHEVETGRRTWEDLPAHILPDIFHFSPCQGHGCYEECQEPEI